MLLKEEISVFFLQAEKENRTVQNRVKTMAHAAKDFAESMKKNFSPSKLLFEVVQRQAVIGEDFFDFI